MPEIVFEWEGLDQQGRLVRGEARAAGDLQVRASLRRQGITVNRVKKQAIRAGRPIRGKDIAIFTRQFATLMGAGVPLLQAFDILSRSSPKPALSRLLSAIRNDLATGTTLQAAFRKQPLYFDKLYCNLVAAGEAAGILDQLLGRLASYLEKTEAMKSKIKSALMYPSTVLLVAFLVSAALMVFVVPSFKQVFASFDAELPGPTLLVMAISDLLVRYGWLILGALVGSAWLLMRALQRSEPMQVRLDQMLLALPIFGMLVQKSCVARWARTLSALFAAGVPLVEALDSVGGACGNAVYASATQKIRREISTGQGLSAAMANAKVFPAMLLQMCAIGEESGAIDSMLGKAAEVYEAEVDDMLSGLASLIEPAIIVMLGLVIGSIVVAMYLPIFRLGQVV